MTEKKKVGRPRKERDEPIARLHFNAPYNIKKMVENSEYTHNYIYEFGAQALLGTKEDKELIEIEKKLAVLKPEVAYLESRKKVILLEKQRTQEIRKQRENELKYLQVVFSQIVRLSEKTGRITLKEEWIAKTYGIQFDVTLANKDFNETVNDLVFPASFLAEKYRIKKIQKGEREEKIMVELIDKKNEA